MAYDNYYPEPDDQSQVGGDDEGGEDKDKKGLGVTALLPKTILAGKKFEPGEEVVLKIVHDYGDEIEVAYAPEKKEGEEDEETDEGEDEGGSGSEMDGAMGKLNSMAE